MCSSCVCECVRMYMYIEYSHGRRHINIQVRKGGSFKFESLLCERIKFYCFKLFLNSTTEDRVNSYLGFASWNEPFARVKLISPTSHNDNNTYRYIIGVAWIFYVKSTVSR